MATAHSAFGAHFKSWDWSHTTVPPAGVSVTVTTCSTCCGCLLQNPGLQTGLLAMCSSMYVVNAQAMTLACYLLRPGQAVLVGQSISGRIVSSGQIKA